MAPTAGILIIGDEILSGKFADENARFLIPELRTRGISLRRIEFVRDHIGDIGDAIFRIASTCELAFTSGGVGPTHDDVTITSIAQAFSTPVIRHPKLEGLLQRYYGGELSEAQLRLAHVPEGTDVLLAEGGKWPVLRFRNIHILPGVPVLFRRCFQSIQDSFVGSPVTHAKVYCRADETDIALTLAEVATANPEVEIGSYPRLDEADFTLLLTVESEDAAAVEAATASLASALGSIVVRVDSPTRADLG